MATALNVPSTRATDIDSYEKALAEARLGALKVAGLQAVCRFLGFCNLTWATVVLLGGFVSNLNKADFHAMGSLLLLQAGRLASAIFSSRLVKTALITLSQNPPHLKLEDHQFLRAWVVRILALFGQVLFILPSIALPVYRLIKIPQDYDFNKHTAGPNNLQESLQIFYILVLSNTAVASLAVIYSAIVLKGLYDSVEQSILRYYDEVLQKSLDNEIVQADSFEFFEFAYTMLGRDFSRNVQPQTVLKHHTKLIRYLYAHRQGIDMVLLFLDWPNGFTQQAAACMVGFWIAEKSHGLPVSLPASVMTKLADKLGPGQVGWTAANSFDLLAKSDPGSDPGLIWKTRDSRGVLVVNSLIDMMDPSTSRSLVVVRVLVSLYKKFRDDKTKVEELGKLKEMFESSIVERKLKEMLHGSKVQRLRVLAGYLLMTMEKLESEEYGSEIGNIIPNSDDYFLRSEVNMFDDLRKKLGLEPFDWSKIQSENFSIKEDEAVKSN